MTMNRAAFRALRPAPTYRDSLSTILPPLLAQHARFSSSLPTVASTSFWKSLIPKPFRRENRQKANQKGKSKEWNPATFYIIIFMLIGSMSINLISAKQDYDRVVRQADVRIGTLREVIEKIQRGEQVDVEKALGTGDPAKELEWEQVLQEIERDDVTRSQRKQDKTKQAPIDSSKQKPDFSSTAQTTSPTKKVSSLDAEFY